jgi:hypothetical protein
VGLQGNERSRERRVTTRVALGKAKVDAEIAAFHPRVSSRWRMTPKRTMTEILRDWHDFYVLMGTATATLIGLMFVAVSIGAGLLQTNIRT